ncbi:DNA recombination protein RmuC [Oscillospiraceae bacterium PP1C4]
MEETTLLWLCIGLAAITCTASLTAVALLVKAKNHLLKIDMQPVLYELNRLREDMMNESRLSRQESSQNISRSISALGQALATNQSQMSREISSRQDSLQQAVTELMRSIDARFHGFTAQSEQQLSGIRSTVESRLCALQEDNSRRLEQMRVTVDEKLQQTLETRIGQSFKIVSERLEQVYKGLGEMQTLATGVGDLKKVLSNVKTRGILGEVQLGAILEQILAPEQYCTNIVTKRDSRNPVEYAVLLPGDEQGSVYLPIDAKFPADAYTQLVNAYESGDTASVAAASALLSSRIKAFARDIRDKYIDPPATTDFAIMFLPFEGLYAEVLRLGLLEPLQRDYKVSIAGPTTMAALLNSLQMGFKTLAIQRRSSEVWDVLGAVKTEFDRFGDVLGATQQRLEQANNELDKLIGVRTRMIQRRLSQISSLPEEQSKQLLEESSGLPERVGNTAEKLFR